MKYPKTTGYVVAVGNVWDGMVLYGPFEDPTDASEWAEQHADGEWHVIAIESIDNVDEEGDDE